MSSNTAEIVESLQLIINKLLNKDATNDQMKFEVLYWDGKHGSRNVYKCISYNEARVKGFEMSENFDNVHITDLSLYRVVFSLCTYK